MIRLCELSENEIIFDIVNDAAQAYKGIIPADRWKEPYMTKEKLLHEIEEGVEFWGYEENGQLLGVMGLQQVDDVKRMNCVKIHTIHPLVEQDSQVTPDAFCHKAKKGNAHCTGLSSSPCFA